MNPLFSVIIPTYNRANLIRGTLQSFQTQLFQNFEVIVVDDGGIDDTKEIVESFHNPKFQYYWKENAERGAARNYGAAIAKGLYLNFFDSDDIAFENHLQLAFNFFQKQENHHKIAHTSYCYLYNSIRYDTAITEGRLNEKIIHTNCLSCNNVFASKEIFESEKFSENRKLSASEDWELWIRLASKYDIIGVADVSSAIVQHPSRSMATASGKSTETRAIELLKEVQNDAYTINMYPTIECNIRREMYSLSALHYAIEGNKSDAIRCLKIALRANYKLVFNRRFLAILKYLLFSSDRV